MALRRCLECSTLFAVGLFRCPLCKSTEHTEEGNEAAMPKITKANGATNARAEQWDGTSSQQSSDLPETTQSEKPDDSESTAKTTGRRSSKGRPAKGSARSAGGSTRN
jgi:hypothetical protein